MRNYRAIILDDQQSSIDHLMEHFQKLEQVRVEAEFTDPYRALAYVRVNPVDLVILDVDLQNRIDGLEWMSAFTGKHTKFILYTGYRQFEDDGYMRNVVDVLLKPVSYQRFATAMKRLDTEIRLSMPGNPAQDPDDHANEYLNVRKDGKWNRRLVWFREITHIRSSNGYLLVHLATDPEVLISNASFRSVMEMLPKRKFKQFSRSMAFNVRFFHSFTSGKVRLKHVSEELPAGNLANHASFREFLETNSV